jgi:hypothetical protein
MKKQEKNNKEDKEKTTPSIPNHWEPVPGQALAAEEIARRIEEEEREKNLKNKKNNK